MATQTKDQLTLDALERELAYYSGTEQYFRHPLGLVFTDGVKALADRAGAYWLIDAVASHQPALRGEGFQLWRLEVRESGKATLTARPDSDEPAIVTQQIPFSDFPVGTFEWYVGDGGPNGTRVMLLKSEY